MASNEVAVVAPPLALTSSGIRKNGILMKSIINLLSIAILQGIQANSGMFKSLPFGPMLVRHRTLSVSMIEKPWRL